MFEVASTSQDQKGQTKMDKVTESFLNQEFSTSEAAEILETPASTFRSYLQREKSLQPDEQETPGGWRRIRPDTVLNIGILQVLLQEGLSIQTAARIVTNERSSMYDGKTVLMVDFDRNNEVAEYQLGDHKTYAGHWVSFINSGYKRMIVINVHQLKMDIKKRINEYPRQG
jgi:DNA-binding transcriptional MerR regulator